MRVRGSLQTRVEKLEQTTGINGGLTIVVTSFQGYKDGQPGTLAGVEVRNTGQFIERRAAESEQDFIERVKADFKGPWTNGSLTLKERRSPS